MCSAPPSPHQETHETQEAHGEACGYIYSPENYLKCFQEHILIDYSIATTSLTMSLLSLLSLLSLSTKIGQKCSAPPSPHQETHETQEAHGEACGYIYKEETMYIPYLSDYI